MRHLVTIAGKGPLPIHLPAVGRQTILPRSSRGAVAGTALSPAHKTRTGRVSPQAVTFSPVEGCDVMDRTERSRPGGVYPLRRHVNGKTIRFVGRPVRPEILLIPVEIKATESGKTTVGGTRRCFMEIFKEKIAPAAIRGLDGLETFRKYRGVMLPFYVLGYNAGSIRPKYI